MIFFMAIGYHLGILGDPKWPSEPALKVWKEFLARLDSQIRAKVQFESEEEGREIIQILVNGGALILNLRLGVKSVPYCLKTRFFLYSYLNRVPEKYVGISLKMVSDLMNSDWRARNTGEPLSPT